MKPDGTSKTNLINDNLTADRSPYSRPGQVRSRSRATRGNSSSVQELTRSDVATISGKLTTGESVLPQRQSIPDLPRSAPISGDDSLHGTAGKDAICGRGGNTFKRRGWKRDIARLAMTG